MNALVVAVNQVKALVGTLSVIMNLCVELRFKLYWPGLEEIFRQLC